MVLASPRVLVEEQVTQNGYASVRVLRGSPCCLLPLWEPLWEPLWDHKSPFKLLPLCWDWDFGCILQEQSLCWFLFICFVCFLIFNYLAAPGLSCGRWTLNCGMRNPAPLPGIELAFPALGAWSLSHWATREVPGFLQPFISSICKPCWPSKPGSSSSWCRSPGLGSPKWGLNPCSLGRLPSCLQITLPAE